MFEELFNYPAVLARHLKAPLVNERRQYLEHLLLLLGLVLSQQFDDFGVAFVLWH
jgi:hypothetical protein